MLHFILFTVTIKIFPSELDPVTAGLGVSVGLCRGEVSPGVLWPARGRVEV